MRIKHQAEIADNDRAFGALLAFLEERGLLDRAAVVFTSDHGEEFWEHGSVGHGNHLFDVALHVPLAIRYPAHPALAAGGRRADEVQTVDLAPTLLELAGLTAPDDLDGVSLLRGPARPSAPAFARLDLDERRFESLRQFPWKLVVELDSGRSQLHRVPEPAGRAGPPPAASPEADATVARLLRWRAARAEQHPEPARPDPGAGPELPEDVKQTLEALGYAE